MDYNLNVRGFEKVILIVIEMRCKKRYTCEDKFSSFNEMWMKNRFILFVQIARNPSIYILNHGRFLACTEAKTKRHSRLIYIK